MGETNRKEIVEKIIESQPTYKSFSTKVKKLYDLRDFLTREMAQNLAQSY